MSSPALSNAARAKPVIEHAEGHAEFGPQRDVFQDRLATASAIPRGFAPAASGRRRHRRLLSMRRPPWIAPIDPENYRF